MGLLQQSEQADDPGKKPRVGRIAESRQGELAWFVQAAALTGKILVEIVFHHGRLFRSNSTKENPGLAAGVSSLGGIWTRQT
jgi:hypothetical protein